MSPHRGANRRSRCHDGRDGARGVSRDRRAQRRDHSTPLRRAPRLSVPVWLGPQERGRGRAFGCYRQARARPRLAQRVRRSRVSRKPWRPWRANRLAQDHRRRAPRPPAGRRCDGRHPLVREDQRTPHLHGVAFRTHIKRLRRRRLRRNGPLACSPRRRAGRRTRAGASHLGARPHLRRAHGWRRHPHGTQRLARACRGGPHARRLLGRAPAGDSPKAYGGGPARGRPRPHGASVWPRYRLWPGQHPVQGDHLEASHGHWPLRAPASLRRGSSPP